MSQIKGQLQVHVNSAHLLFEIQLHGLQHFSGNACQHMYTYFSISLILFYKQTVFCCTMKMKNKLN